MLQDCSRPSLRKVSDVIWSKRCTPRTSASMFIHSLQKKNLSRTLEFRTAALLWAFPLCRNIALMKYNGPACLQHLFGLFKSKLCFHGRQVWGIGNSASGASRLTKKALKPEPQHTLSSLCRGSHILIHIRL